MNWRPVSELTAKIVESAWRLIVWTDSGEWLIEKWATIEGCELCEPEDGLGWGILDQGYVSEQFWTITHFAVIDAPPEA